MLLSLFAQLSNPVGSPATYAATGGSTYPIYGGRDSNGTGSGGAHSIMPPTLMTNCIVKYC